MKTLFCAVGLTLVPCLSPAFAQTGEQDVEAMFKAAFSEVCLFDPASAAADYYPTQSWTLTWDEEYSDTPATATLYAFFCSSGAYNVNLVYYLEQPDAGAVPVAFAVPDYDVNYVDDDYEGEVDSIQINGFTTQFTLTNPEFDPDSQTITNTALWRGIGDASSGGRWVFSKGAFVLKSYDVDATYDGEINSERIVEFK